MAAAPKTWIILGATSAMGRAFARLAAREGADIVLAGRDIADMEATAADIRVMTGRAVTVEPFDAAEYAGHGPFTEKMAGIAGVLNVFLVFGLMPDQVEMDTDPDRALDCIAATYTGAVSVLHRLAPVLESRGAGIVIGVGSVAGDRGRIKNYVYGSAKAGLHTYLAGLRNRLGRRGVHVMTVKPGFVDTAMTWGLPGMFLVASPDAIARRCLTKSEKGADIIYAPGFWWFIMTIFKLVPERIFKKLSV